MKLPMFKRLATDVAPPFAALLAFIACALALGLLMEVCGSQSCASTLGPIPSNQT